MSCWNTPENRRRQIIAEAVAELKAGALRAVKDLYTGALKLERADGQEISRDMADDCIITGAAALALYDDTLREALEGTTGQSAAEIIHAHGHTH